MGTAAINHEIANVKLRRAPNGKIYAVHNGAPLCDEDGGLLYFDTEADVWGFLERRQGLRAPANAVPQRCTYVE